MGTEVYNHNEFERLALSLGDSPDTVIPAHLLRRGMCSVVQSGSTESPLAAVFYAQLYPEEPWPTGTAYHVWELLKGLPEWRRVSVTQELADSLGPLIEASTSSVILRPDTYHVLSLEHLSGHLPLVRILTTQDRQLVQASGLVPDGGALGSIDVLLSEGAGIILHGELVSLAYASAFSARFADVGVDTRPEWRNRGFATGAATAVVRALAESGLKAVWSTGEENYASRRVAEKIGIEETVLRVLIER